MKIKLEVTPAQLRYINAALALSEASGGEDDPAYRQSVMDRTRDAVQTAMVRHKVSP